MRTRLWTDWDNRTLRVLASAWPIETAAWYFDRTVNAVRQHSRKLGIQFKSNREHYTTDEDQSIRINYPRYPAFIIAHLLGKSTTSVSQRAARLGVTKSPDFYKQWHTPLWHAFQTEGSKASRFKKGSVPANKGLRRPGWAPGRMAQTQFRKGRPAHESRNYVPIGTEKYDVKRKVMVRKVTDDPAVFPAQRWRPVHTMVWESVNGPVPAGHIVRFRDGMKTLDTPLITIDLVELVTLAENMRRNTIHNYPPEIKRAMQLRGVLNRHIHKLEKAETSQ